MRVRDRFTKHQHERAPRPYRRSLCRRCYSRDNRTKHDHDKGKRQHQLNQYVSSSVIVLQYGRILSRLVTCALEASAHDEIGRVKHKQEPYRIEDAAECSQYGCSQQVCEKNSMMPGGIIVPTVPATETDAVASFYPCSVRALQGLL